MKTYPVYEVKADLKTGKWLNEPVFTGEKMRDATWYKQQDTDRVHYDTYEHFHPDSPIFSETRAIRVIWI